MPLSFMEKFIEYLQKAEKIIKTSDHLIYVSFPLVKEKRIILKTISEIEIAIKNCINSILQYEYIYKRIRLYQDPKKNFETFKDKCAPRYNITEKDIELIIELFEIVKKHKQSDFEFVKEEKVVILSKNLKQETITIEKTKKFLELAKDILEKAKRKVEESLR